MVVRIAGRRMYLRRAVDQEGEILDLLVQQRRDKRAAVRLMRKLLRKQGSAPKLRSPTSCPPTPLRSGRCA
jgi:transposase-like protein